MYKHHAFFMGWELGAEGEARFMWNFLKQRAKNSEVPYTKSASHHTAAKLNVYYMKFSVEMRNKLQNSFLSVMQASSFQGGLCSGHVKCNVYSVLST